MTWKWWDAITGANTFLVKWSPRSSYAAGIELQVHCWTLFKNPFDWLLEEHKRHQATRGAFAKWFYYNFCVTIYAITSRVISRWYQNWYGWLKMSKWIVRTRNARSKSLQIALCDFTYVLCLFFTPFAIFFIRMHQVENDQCTIWYERYFITLLTVYGSNCGNPPYMIPPRVFDKSNAFISCIDLGPPDLICQIPNSGSEVDLRQQQDYFPYPLVALPYYEKLSNHLLKQEMQTMMLATHSGNLWAHWFL